MIVFSFNKPAGKFNYIWNEFSLDGMAAPVRLARPARCGRDEPAVALWSTVFSTILGHDDRAGPDPLPVPGTRRLNGLIFLPMATPEIVLGASLLTLFVATALPPLAGAVPTLYPTGFGRPGRTPPSLPDCE